MGRFSTTVQIKSGLGAAKFINSFCEVMEKRGFVKCTEDECALSYFMAFSNGGWVTLSSDKYSDDPRKAKDDVQQIAEGMKTAAFSVEVVDSDFAILTLNDGDSIIVGDGSGYGIEDAPKGERSKWEPLLAEGKTWEQLAECRDKNEVFVEDALWEAAPVLGIEPDYICADFEELSGKAEGSKNISTLYFKKADSKGKAMSLNAAFVKVFGEGLEPLGFKKVKGRQPYFVRVVPGGEIIHVITYVNEETGLRDRKAFNIHGGIATVYRRRIDFSTTPRDNKRWLEPLYIFSHKLFFEKNSGNDHESIVRFEYAVEDDETRKIKQIIRDNGMSVPSWFKLDFDEAEEMQSAVKRAFEETKRVILPMLNPVTTLESCIDYFYKFGWIMNLYDEEDFGNSDPNLFCNEGLLLIKAHYLDNGEERMKCNLKAWYQKFGKGDKERLKKKYEEYNRNRLEQYAIREKLLNTPKLYKKAMDELERRRRLNIETLRSYGINI